MLCSKTIPPPTHSMDKANNVLIANPMQIARQPCGRKSTINRVRVILDSLSLIKHLIKFLT